MANNLYQQLNPQITQQELCQSDMTSQLLNMMRFTNNPNALIQSLVEANPRFSSIMALLQGSSPRETFMAQANKMGVDPNQIINMLRN